MAEGYLRHVAGDCYEVLSAGISPKGLNPLAVEAMHEIGIDISTQHSKDVRQYLGTSMQYVVTVCDHARERCPVFPGVFEFLHWSLEDPALADGSHEQQLSVFRRVRDQIICLIDGEFGRQARSAD